MTEIARRGPKPRRALPFGTRASIGYDERDAFSSVKMSLELLKTSALASFRAALDAVDPSIAVRGAVELRANELRVGGNFFCVDEDTSFFAVAFGKAAFRMASGLDEVLHGRLSAGVASGPAIAGDAWPDAFSRQIFDGGHPLPTSESLRAGQAALDCLKSVDDERALVFFLVSGGGSAMLDVPPDERISLEILRETNRILTSCGAPIAEINALRRRISSIKGGCLAGALTRARAVTLIVSDTNPGEAFNVASGPTIPPPATLSSDEVRSIIARYDLETRLSPVVLRELMREQTTPSSDVPYEVILDNDDAVRAAKSQLESEGFDVEIADDLVEAEVETGCAELVARLLNLRAATPRGKSVAVVSGGEFVCPVRGDGVGGRNLESALRTAMIFDEWRQEGVGLAALFAGTDGVDGNSPAAGAFVDQTTIDRGRHMNLDAANFLVNSDAYRFLSKLGDAIETGPTGTNVRDVRILLAK